jgi:hypothetical protein
MDEQHLTRGLSALADEHVARTVDVDRLAALIRFRRRRRWTVAGAAIGVAALVAGLVVATRRPVEEAEPMVAAIPGKWILTEFAGIELNPENVLYAVAAISESDAWAVGRYKREDKGPDLSLAVHWNGRQWQRVEIPGAGALENVVAVAADDVWVVGTASTPGRGGFAAHWDGRKWTERPGPVPDGLPAGRSVLLRDIAVRSATDAWAVGCTAPEGSGQEAPLIQHWDGRQWRLVPVPDQLSGATGCLRSVAAIAGNDVWAVGAGPGQQGGKYPLALHWDGQQWSIVAPAGPFGPLAYGSFSKVIALGPNDVWAFGGFAEFAQRWDGHSWQHYPGPSDSEFEVLAAAPDGRGGLVVGTRPPDGRGLMNLRRWDGKTWTQYPSLDLYNGAPPARQQGGIPGLGVVPESDILWAVGWRFGETGREPQPLQQSVPLAALTSLQS